MPGDILQTGGVGGAGALFGALITWAGFKSRLDKLESGVVLKETCGVCEKASSNRGSELAHRLDRLEATVTNGFSEIHRRLDNMK